MTPGIAAMFGSGFAEPMVDERLGRFQNVRIPVSHFSDPQNFKMNLSDVDYLVPQTQKEHNDLLNKFYHTRKENPMWKEMGREAEKDSPHFSDKDTTLRKDIKARSSFVSDIVYDPETKNLMVQLGNGGKYYTYSCTPDQLREFLSAGSLGKEINRIKWNKGTSLQKTSARQQPRSGSSISKLFGV